MLSIYISTQLIRDTYKCITGRNLRTKYYERIVFNEYTPTGFIENGYNDFVKINS